MEMTKKPIKQILTSKMSGSERGPHSLQQEKES